MRPKDAVPGWAVGLAAVTGVLTLGTGAAWLMERAALSEVRAVDPGTAELQLEVPPSLPLDPSSGQPAPTVPSTPSSIPAPSVPGPISSAGPSAPVTAPGATSSAGGVASSAGRAPASTPAPRTSAPTPSRTAATAGTNPVPAPSASSTSVTSAPASSPPAARPPASNPATDPVSVTLQRELVDELNRRRSALGLPGVAYTPNMSDLAAECALQSLDLGRLEHCGHEVLWMGGPGVSAERLLDAWFASPPHRRALTYPSSTTAGGALVVRDGGSRAVAALRIDY